MDVLRELCVCCLVTVFIGLARTVPEYEMDEHCGQTLALNIGTIESVRLQLTGNTQYNDNLRCAMRIQAPEGKKLIIRIQTLDIQGVQESLCQGGDYLQVFDGPTESSMAHQALPRAICQKPEVAYISTVGRFLVLRFVSNNDMVTGAGFKFLVTAYNPEPCGHNEYRCLGTGYCIQESLRCNGYNNCPDGSDESMPECLSPAAIAGIAVGGVVILAAIVILIIVVCVLHERRKRARIIKRALSIGGFPETVWDVSKTPPLETSHVDPIWDGTATFSTVHAKQPHNADLPWRTSTSGHLTRHAGKTGNTSRHSGNIGSVVRSSAKFRSASTGEYANFPLNVFGTMHSEEHPIMDNDELASRATLAVPPSHDSDMTQLHSTFGGNRRRSDIAFAQYKDNPMTVL